MEAMKNFFRNAVTNPRTSLMGLLKLLVSAGTCYAMATGKAQVDATTVGVAGTAFAAGVSSLMAQDATGRQIAAAAQQVADTATQVAPAAVTVIDQYHQMRQEANAAQQKIDAFTAVTAALSTALQVIPAPAPAPAPAVEAVFPGPAGPVQAEALNDLDAAQKPAPPSPEEVEAAKATLAAAGEQAGAEGV